MSLHLGLRRHGKHRAADAGPRISALEAALATARADQAKAELAAVARQADVADLTDERDQLRAELNRLQAVLAPYLAAEATAGAVTVPEMVRDTSAPEDQATTPIEVTTLREQFGQTAA